MKTTGKLSKKQMAFIDALFEAGLDSEQVMAEQGVSGSLYRRWQGEEVFAVEFDRRIEWLRRQSEALIARYASVAAAKLIQLTDSEKEETARKACLDIISLPSVKNGDKKPQQGPDAQGQIPHQLSEQTASRLLEALARENT